jgi:hypothetical protein
MASWYVNRGLAILIAAVKLLFPGITIYTIGDTSHAARKSDHNPNAAGRVNAADFMLGKLFTHVKAIWLCAWLIQDPRTKYVIYNRRIWQNGKWTDYDGSDPHTNHVHLSVWDNANSNTKPWKLEVRKVAWLKFDITVPVLQEGDSDDDFEGYRRITRFQKIKGIEADGVWGPATSKALGVKKMTEKVYRELFGLGDPS